MTGAWIEMNAPTLARVGLRQQWWVPGVLVLGATYLVVGLAAEVSRWRVGQLWGDPGWEFERTVWPHAAALTVLLVLVARRLARVDPVINVSRGALIGVAGHPAPCTPTPQATPARG